MAPTRNPRRRAALLTIGYILLCGAGTIVQGAFQNIEEAAAQADGAASAAAEALNRAEENEDDLSELRDTVEDLQTQMEYR